MKDSAKQNNQKMMSGEMDEIDNMEVQTTEQEAKENISNTHNIGDNGSCCDNTQEVNGQNVNGNNEQEQIDFDKLLKSKWFSLFLKRTFDICASFLGIIVLLPMFAIVSLIIAMSSRGGVFFKQVRVGKNGKQFKIIKFRTMVVDAEAKGLQITVGKDMRITGIGKFLRKTKLDELPQLFNVFVGQMSFVGPRPEVCKYVDLYTPYQKNILRVRPGITELASIVYRDENEVLANSQDPEQTYINIVMQEKLKLNIQYIQKLGFWYDIYLIFKTFLAILK